MTVLHKYTAETSWPPLWTETVNIKSSHSNLLQYTFTSKFTEEQKSKGWKQPHTGLEQPSHNASVHRRVPKFWGHIRMGVANHALINENYFQEIV